MAMSVTNAGTASPMYRQLTWMIWRIIIQPTKIRVQPVAQGGIEANIGAKKMEMMKQTPVVIAVKPVFPPSAIPAPDSMNAVTGETPNNAPMEMQMASVQYAMVALGNEPSFSTTPEKRAMLYSVAVASMMSTYKNVNRARANCAGCDPAFQEMTLSVFCIGCAATTCLKKSNLFWPSSV